MSISYAQDKQVPSSADLFHRLEQYFTFANFKSFVDQAIRLRSIGFKISNDYTLASSIFLSQIAKLEDVKDCSCMKQEKTISLLAYLDKTNFETEERIYEIHRQLLESFPETNIEVRVVELYGRKKGEVEALVE
jgi:hypothetical protein